MGAVHVSLQVSLERRMPEGKLQQDLGSVNVRQYLPKETNKSIILNYIILYTDHSFAPSIH